MKMNRPIRILAKAAQSFERRPWLLAAAFLASDLLVYLTLAILFTNHCPSQFRFVPELSDEFASFVSDVYDFSLKLSVVVGAVMVVAPILPLIFRRYRTVVVMLVLGIVVMKAGRGGLELIPWSCRSALAEQMRVVRLNVERKKASLRQGDTEWLRVSVHKFEVRQWYFYDKKYCIRKPDNAVDKEIYFLCDEKWRHSRYDKDMWDGRVLLDNVVHWGECGQQLHLETKDGKRHVLDYATGELRQQECDQ